jgi:hypothetical protein
MKNQSSIAYAIAIGAGVGAAMGSATHHMGVWLSLGVGVSLAIGIAIRDRKNCLNATQPKSSVQR